MADDILQEGAVLDDAIRVYRTDRIVDSALLADGLDGIAFLKLVDSAVLSDRCVPTRNHAGRLTDGAVLDDALRAAARQDALTDAVVLDDAITSSRADRISDGAVLHDTARVTAVRSGGRLVDSALLEDRAGWWPRQGRLGDAAVLDDALVADPVRGGRLSDGAVLSDAMRDVSAPLDRLSDSAVLGEALRAHAVRMDRLTDAAAIGARTLRLRAGIAWTANVDTWAMSMYDGLEPSEIAGDWAVGPDGVYVRDDEMPVAACIQTGEVDLAEGMLTNLPEAQVEIGTEGKLVLTAVAVRDRRTRRAVDYVVRGVDAEPQQRQVDLGRRPAGRRWSFKIANPDGQPFALRSLRVRPELIDEEW